MVEENISQEFRLKHIDEARNRAKEIDEQEAQKDFYNAKLCLKEGKMLLFPNVNKTLTDLRNPFAR